MFHVLLVVSLAYASFDAWGVNRDFLVNSRHLLIDTPALSSWNSPLCREFYSSHIPLVQYSTSTDDPQPPSRQRPFWAFEDTHPFGRQHSIDIPAQEAIVSDRYKFVYVMNRKAASSTIYQILEQVFGANVDWCFGRCQWLPVCGGIGWRCSTKALNQTHLKDYFVFSFVRHPISRWFAAYAQAHWMHKTSPELASIEHAKLTLRRYLSSRIHWEHHLQSQSHSLSSTTLKGETMRYNFIGKLENFEKDWAFVISTICSRLPEGTCPQNWQSRKVQPPNTSRWRQNIDMFQNDSALLGLIKEAYVQDAACFGYSLS